MAEKLKPRIDIPEELKWDLTAIFETQEEFEKAAEQLPKDVKIFADKYSGKLDNVELLIEAIQAYEALMAKASHLEQYGILPVSVDILDSEAQQQARHVSNVLANVSADLSFFNSQIQEIEAATLNQLIEKEPNYTSFVRKIKAAKKAKLDSNVEKALAQLSPTFEAPSEIFEQARSADADYGTFEVDGKEYELSFVLYEEVYMYHKNPKIRRAAYDQFNKVLGQYQNVVATAYYTHLQSEKTLATMRGYDSIFDYLLESQEVSQDLYHRQIDMIMNDFAPVMRKFVTHLKEVHGLDKMTYADLKVDLDPDYTTPITIEESKDLVKNAMAPLGEKYVNMILRSYPERWTDFAQNIGKRSGAFCSTTYGKHPYVMITWTGELTDAYTLFHELGHAGQGVLSNENNPLTSAEPSLYLIEGPSTFNELLLTDYLQNKSEDPRMERSVLSKMISKTYFHNFVTHLLEAAYQREVYKLIDAGKSFDAKKLSEIKRSILEQFWGDAVELEPGAELTWMRQIHYYMGLYPYTYSAGLTIATQAFLKIKSGEEKVDGWLEFLALGGQKVPAEATLVAGVDITTDRPLSDTIKYLDQSVDRIIELTGELNN
ncbi:oligoendopeptidase F [Marinilactibacillus psychrotolerans]|uniref:Oligopeptidase F n=2 Tax=Marinilactibacillus psychrotolerans TaxID=191770 RepID=A0A5R9C118_9LACT|nr:oligoendopeptidase F [Marinilactibacillus psychrotolerans]TLQ06369.1 oligoendopeptidase F [Marinilactibacillus psychrotolerans]GEQ33900.1 oligoendopeptidase F [Marinilactibacillus psychrotolerans]SJN22450.1 Oligoendopeptidase F [Marinilactibacillus psychrotolerans 42ea]